MNPKITITVDAKNKATASISGIASVGAKIDIDVSGLLATNIPNWGASDDFTGPSLRFRLVDECGRDLVRFPLRKKSETNPDAWTETSNVFSATNVDFDTDVLRKSFFGVSFNDNLDFGIILDSIVDKAEYATGRMKVAQWRVASTEDPTVLPDWRETLSKLTVDLASVEASKTSAAASATQSGVYAANASTSASLASGYAITASNSASTAIANAVDASNSSTSASNSASSASLSAISASTSAINAVAAVQNYPRISEDTGNWERYVNGEWIDSGVHAKGDKGNKGDKGDKGETGATGTPGPQGEIGPQGAQGIQGPQGSQGIQGMTGPQGQPGPQGIRGEKGDTGPQGDGSYIYDSSDGKWHNVTVFTDPDTGDKTTNVNPIGIDFRPGVEAPTTTVEQTETGAVITTNDCIHGQKTATIQNGTAATISVGTTSTSEPGTSASVTNSGTSSAAVFNFTIPKGDKGDAATIAVGTTTTSAAGTAATVTNSGTSSAAVFDFTIPRGADGVTPVLTSSKSWKTTTIYVNGSTVLATIQDGIDGEGSVSGAIMNDDPVTLDTDGKLLLGTVLQDASAFDAAGSASAAVIAHNTDARHIVTGEKATWNAKQDAISDLATIRSGAALGATSLQDASAFDAAGSASGAVTSHLSDITHLHVTSAEKEAWNAKQNALTFENAPTSGSTNPITSGGVYTHTSTANIHVPIEVVTEEPASPVQGTIYFITES